MSNILSKKFIHLILMEHTTILKRMQIVAENIRVSIMKLSPFVPKIKQNENYICF